MSSVSQSSLTINSYSSSKQSYYNGRWSDDRRVNGHSNGSKHPSEVTSKNGSHQIPNETEQKETAQKATVSHISKGILKRPLEEGELSLADGQERPSKKTKTVRIFTDPEIDPEIKSINTSVESLFTRLNEEIQDKKERLYRLDVMGWNFQQRLNDLIAKEGKHKESEIQLKMEQEKFSKDKEAQQTQLKKTAEWMTRVEAREAELKEKEKALESKEANVARKSEEIEELKNTYTQRLQGLAEQEIKVKEKEASLVSKEEKLKSKKEEFIKTIESLKDI